MDDFLGSLVLKSLGLAPVLQPRPVSRFEPWSTDGVLETANSDLDAPSETERAAAGAETGTLALPREDDLPVRARPDPLHPAPRHQDDIMPPHPPTLQPFPPSEPGQAVMHQAGLISAPAPSQPTAQVGEASGERGALPAPTDRSGVEREALPVPLKETVGSVPVLPVPVLDRLQPIVEQTPTQRAAVGRERPDPSRADQPSLARSPVPATLGALSAAQPVVPPIVERMELATEKQGGGQDTRSGSLWASPPPAAVPRPLPDPQPPAPPTIHVTIGRIEVRATPPPAPVTRSAPTASTMSLEDYLRSHTGKGR